MAKVNSKIDALTEEVQESNDNLVGKLTKLKEKAEATQTILKEVCEKVNKLIVQKNNQVVDLDAPPAKRAYLP